MSTVTRCIALLLSTFAASAAAHDSWTRVDDVGRDPVAKTVREQFDFAADGRVDVRQIGGNVDVKVGAGDKVEFTYEKRAASQQDFDCEELRYEHHKDELRIWVEKKRERACRMIRASDTLTLTVPRGASVTLRSIGDKATVAGVQGLVRLESIGDSATVTGAHELEADSIGDSLRVDVASLGPEGLRIESVGDSLELNLPEKLDARLRIESVGDQIRAPGLHRDSDHDNDDVELTLGKGGPLIHIESVGDTVVIHGPQMTRTEPL